MWFKTEDSEYFNIERSKVKHIAVWHKDDSPCHIPIEKIADEKHRYYFVVIETDDSYVYAYYSESKEVCDVVAAFLVSELASDERYITTRELIHKALEIDKKNPLFYTDKELLFKANQLIGRNTGSWVFGGDITEEEFFSND